MRVAKLEMGNNFHKSGSTRIIIPAPRRARPRWSHAMFQCRLARRVARRVACRVTPRLVPSPCAAPFASAVSSAAPRRLLVPCRVPRCHRVPAPRRALPSRGPVPCAVCRHRRRRRHRCRLG